MKQLPDDFREFLSLLIEKQVEYLVVGGWALGVHGYVRATGDMDIWIGSNETNLDRLLNALFAFGVPKEVSKDFFREKGNVFRMGSPPMRIEIITEATGVEFLECYSNKIELVLDELSVPFISYEDFVLNKRSSGRLKDLADLESLGEDVE
ncbi:MAG: hypothetical protein O3C43_10020 [Verrucomicrobia bacterium]|nr:hypothetical protein [Verrucomicrobiota bacterium]MDA1066828.1 hypothetical protein [Verrucomicrobiota bacterium]